MKTALIAATFAGIAGAVSLLMIRNRLRRDQNVQPSYDPNDRHRNPLGKVIHKVKMNRANNE